MLKKGQNGIIADNQIRHIHADRFTLRTPVSYACACGSPARHERSGTDAVDFGLIDAYQKKNLRALQHYAAEYRSTPIEPYLFAARINARDAAKGTLSASVAQGLGRFAGVPPVEKTPGGSPERMGPFRRLETV